ncbi:MAG: response regulator [Chloroflexi bacterium]|uniref:response regulator n=1 Tax=Candidatus Flexifilum breve TaxID=3140694 RepID=UPI003135F8AC|nr:response regulator [Chloroflexota bacterium]
MYKVIFLDDALITLQMLESAIDWQQYSIVLSGVATDGEEGLALFEQVQPDIIIADIRMPKMNGIEFARAIRQTKGPVKIILLSAYAEFEYAQSALTYQISDYLLKPLDEKQIRGGGGADRSGVGS